VSDKVVNPRDLLLKQLAELLWIERTLFSTVIPAVHDASHDPRLQQALTHHRAQTREHCVRLEEAMRSVGAEPAAARSATLEKMKEEHEENAQSFTHPVLRDVFHCAGVARTEHFELAAYDAAIGLAKELGQRECANLLSRNRDEDAAALKEAEKLAAKLRGELPPGS
jgi:ferritin-like metal-binding protein YciE